MNISAIWASMTTGRRAVAVIGLLIPVVLVGVAAFSLSGVGRPGPSPSPGDIGALPTDASPAPTSTSTPIVSASIPASSASVAPSPAGPNLLGTDGRLTLLLLGSDYRPAHPGNRTDAMMVVSVDPTTGKSAAFSVPRDIVDFPLPKGGVYHPKLNALYQQLQSTTQRGAAGIKDAFGKAFGVEIDNYVLIGFTGVRELVAAVGGVDVTLAKAYYDPEYWVDAQHRGWGLPAGTSHLNGREALIFARSRKGDSDYGRAARQQQLVMAAFTKLVTRGVTDLPKLLSIAKDTVRTDLPLARVADLFTIYSKANLNGAKRAVFGPRSYATQAAVPFSYRLRIAECRTWIAKNFPAVRVNGTWPATN